MATLSVLLYHCCLRAREAAPTLSWIWGKEEEWGKDWHCLPIPAGSPSPDYQPKICWQGMAWTRGREQRLRPV